MPKSVIFSPAKKGGVCTRYEGRVAFPSRDGVQPEDGDEYEVLNAVSNKAGNVYFLTLGKRISTEAEREAEAERAQQQRVVEEQRRKRLGAFYKQFVQALSQTLKERYSYSLVIKLECEDTVRLRYSEDWRYEAARNAFIYIYTRDDEIACKLHENERASTRCLFLCCSAQFSELDVTNLVCQALAWIADCYDEWRQEAEAAYQESLQRFPTLQDYLRYQRAKERAREADARRAYEDPDWYQSTRYDYW